jgi:hypothetical protein
LWHNASKHRITHGPRDRAFLFLWSNHNKSELGRDLSRDVSQSTATQSQEPASMAQKIEPVAVQQEAQEQTIIFPGAVKTFTLSAVSFSPFVLSIW